MQVSRWRSGTGELQKIDDAIESSPVQGNVPSEAIPAKIPSLNPAVCLAVENLCSFDSALF